MFKRQEASLDVLFNRTTASWSEQFLKSPLKTLANTIYQLRHPLRQQNGSAIRIVCISDTHNSQPKIPTGDVLIHAGDLTQSGSIKEIQVQLDWLKSQPHHHKVFIAGNHDKAFESDEQDQLDWTGMVYLQDSSAKVEFPNGRALSLYGSPWTRKHGNWAFQYPANEDFWYSRVPLETDILITHMSPRFHLDIDGWGDEGLLKELWRTRPALHVFGHFHAGYGSDLLTYDSFESSYAGVRRGTEGWMGVLDMAWRLIVCKLRDGPFIGTQLVNASVVGGLRDDLIRDPIEVSV